MDWEVRYNHVTYRDCVKRGKKIFFSVHVYIAKIKKQDFKKTRF
jgi:hypothetical protein